MKIVKLSAVFILIVGSLSAQTITDHRTRNWIQLPGGGGKDVTINNKGSIYMVSTAGKLYNYTGSEWMDLGDNNLATYAETYRLAIKVYNNGLMMKRQEGFSFKTNQLEISWIKMDGSDARDLAILSGISGIHPSYWMVNTVGKIYKYSYGPWHQQPGSDGVRIAAGGEQVWLINTVGKIYRFKNLIPYLNQKMSGGWEQMPGSDGRDIAIDSDGTVWLVNTAGKVYRWYGNGWALQTSIKSGYRVAANNGKVVILTTDGKFYYSEN